MRAILGTIALEPNRWTGKRNPRMDLFELLPRVKAAGFDKLEVWQWHVSTHFLSDVREIKAKGDDLGVSFPVIGVYPAFHLEGIDSREEARIQSDILDKGEVLGSKMFKIMLGKLKGNAITPAQMKLTVERFGAWYREAKARGFAVAVELHGGTIFDPVEKGLEFMASNPELDFGICYQPYDFTNTEAAIKLAERFKGRIAHIHLQAPMADGMYALLEEGGLDYRQLLPLLVRDNPSASMTLEFVRDCIQNDKPFDLEPVLASASQDAEFIEHILDKA